MSLIRFLFNMAFDKQRFIIAISLLTAFLFYSFYIYSSLPVKDYHISEQSNNGKMVWQKYNCIACHQLYGLGGYLGPDLTNVYGLRDSTYIRSFMQNGTNIMPAFPLSEKETTDLISFFKTVNETGSSDPRTFTIQPNGTIKQ